MELKDYIKTVLVDICDAVYEAKTEAKQSAIAPHNIDGVQVDREHLINFEISVAVSDSLSGGGEGKIQVLSIGASAGGKMSKETQNINKISFSIPVFYSAKFTN